MKQKAYIIMKSMGKYATYYEYIDAVFLVPANADTLQNMQLKWATHGTKSPLKAHKNKKMIKYLSFTEWLEKQKGFIKIPWENESI